MSHERVSGSFRDPSGFLYVRDGILYRQVNASYRESYDQLHESGLLESLWKQGLLIPHEESDISQARTDDAYRVLRPTRVPFISYPYEWCFSAYRDAALATLKIQAEALQYGMTLKDASAYNIQFLGGKPVFIDTLSFEPYKQGQPWVAYRQFCQHFLAPLALMSRKDIRLNALLQCHIDGIPLDLCSHLLGLGSRFSPRFMLHIHAHAKTQARYASSSQPAPHKAQNAKLSMVGLQGILDNLKGTIEALQWKPEGTEWGDYYNFTNYNDESFAHKRKTLESFLDQTNPQTVWDLGANNGAFSRVASTRGISTVSFDIDPAAVEKSYRNMRDNGEKNILPLLQDLTNPSASIGWDNTERDSLAERGPADMAFALALIHHLAISNNAPLVRVAEFFSKLCKNLVIEFVPKEDSQVQKLLVSREDIFPNYHRTGFEEAFASYFSIHNSVPIDRSCRILYRMESLNMLN
jgi:hypothetical protein